jgi:hypothetical protein
MTHRFASIASSDKLAYVYASDHHYDGRSPISTHFRFYETYGDGMTAHSPSAPIPVGMLADYLFSLAQAMASDNELIEAAAYEVRSGIASNSDIRFAQSVVFKDGKRRWVSREERKVTSSEAKRHDRRYEEVLPRHDGTPKGAYNVLWRDFYDGIRALGLAYSIFRYRREVEDNYFGNGAAVKLLGWDNVDGERLERAFECALAVIEAHDRLSNAARGVKSYARGIEEARQAAPSQEVA